MYLFQIGPLRFGKYAQVFALDQIFFDCESIISYFPQKFHNRNVFEC